MPRDIYHYLHIQSLHYGTQPPKSGDLSVGKTSEGLLDIVLGLGTTVTGTVRNARNEVVPNSSVLLYPIAGRQHPSFFKTDEADKNGAFTITGVAPGDYRVLGWEDSLPSMYLDPKFLSAFAARATTVTTAVSV